MSSYECAWCKLPQPEDEPYLAWDWHICRTCFQDMERENYEDHMRRQREQRLEQ